MNEADSATVGCWQAISNFVVNGAYSLAQPDLRPASLHRGRAPMVAMLRRTTSRASA